MCYYLDYWSIVYKVLMKEVYMNNWCNGFFCNSLFYILMFLSLMGIIYFFFGGNFGL